MRVIARTSSTIATDSSRTRTPGGAAPAARARTPSANGASVATGIAHADPAAAQPETINTTSAGATMPPTAARPGAGPRGDARAAR
jgi:hypothetical protein